MFRRYVPREKENPSQIPSFDHDPEFIRFRSWTALLSLSGEIPEGHRPDEVTVFLDEQEEAYESETVRTGQSLSLRNSTRFALMNLGIVCGRTGEPVFHAHELPPRRKLRLEFIKEGHYSVHYSPAFSGVTLRRNLRVVPSQKNSTHLSSNFQPRFRSKRWK